MKIQLRDISICLLGLGMILNTFMINRLQKQDVFLGETIISVYEELIKVKREVKGFYQL